jgi:predicted  nucleic acid-binding Zn-ribbon protein
MSRSTLLFRLQQIDSQLDNAHTRIEEIDTKLTDNKDLIKAEQYNTIHIEKLNKVKDQLRSAEREVDNQRNKLELAEAKLYSGKVKNPKELQDLQNESAALKRYLNVLEDRQLEVMLLVEEAEEKLSEAKTNLQEVQIQSSDQKEKLNKERTNLLREVERLDIERHTVIGSVNSEDEYNYQRLREKRSGVAVACIKDNTCSACGSTLTAALIQSAQSSNHLVHCPSCRRIIFVN